MEDKQQTNFGVAKKGVTAQRQTHNERFHASGSVCPQKHLWKVERASPARTFVKPLPR